MKNHYLKRIDDLVAIGKTHRTIKKKPRCNHIAGIWLDGRIICYGRNQLKTHPLQAKFSDRPNRIYLHAEIDAIVKFLQLHPIQNFCRAEMIVIRIDSDGLLAPSKPCLGCQKAIITFGFKDIKWS